MSTTYKMRDGDDARDMVITLKENNRTLSADPVEALLKINKGGSVVSRPLTGSGDEWHYRWTDADFTELGTGSFSAEVVATYSDGSQATFPTSGSLTITILPVLE